MKGYYYAMLVHSEKEVTEWNNTRFERFKDLCNQTKGNKARDIFCCHLEAKGISVPRDDNGDYAFDKKNIIEIDGKEYTVRCACVDNKAKEGKKIIIANHIRWQDDWDFLVFFLVFPNKTEMYIADRDEIDDYLLEHPDAIRPIDRENQNVHHWTMKYTELPDVFRPLT
jgi:hypothetical protein